MCVCLYESQCMFFPGVLNNMHVVQTFGTKLLQTQAGDSFFTVDI